MKKIEKSVKKLVNDHHKEMKEWVRGQLEKLLKEILEEDNDERIRI